MKENMMRNLAHKTLHNNLNHYATKGLCLQIT
jgi:hypothetical protein